MGLHTESKLTKRIIQKIAMLSMQNTHKKKHKKRKYKTLKGNSNTVKHDTDPHNCEKQLNIFNTK